MLTLTQLQTQYPELERVDYSSVSTPLEIAALILRINGNAHEIESLMDNTQWQRGVPASLSSVFALQEEGRITGVFVTNPKNAWAGLSLVMDSITNPCDLPIEDMAFLLAVATPVSSKYCTPQMADIFLQYAEKLVQELEEASAKPKQGKALRTLPSNIVYIQNILAWMDLYLSSKVDTKEADLKNRAIEIARKFEQHLPVMEIPLPTVLEPAWNILYRHAGAARVGDHPAVDVK